MFILKLKSGEYYDFSNIKEVLLLNEEKIEILGNYAKGKRYKRVILNVKMVINLRAFLKFLKKNKRMFYYEGKCPKCESVDVFKYKKVLAKSKLNNPRIKTKYISESLPISLECNKCKQKFTMQELNTKCNIVLYY